MNDVCDERSESSRCKNLPSPCVCCFWLYIKKSFIIFFNQIKSVTFWYLVLFLLFLFAYPHWCDWLRAGGLHYDQRLQSVLKRLYNVGINLTRKYVSIQQDRSWFPSGVKANTSRRSIVVLLLVHRLRRWPSIKTTMAQRLAFAGVLIIPDAGIDCPLSLHLPIFTSTADYIVDTSMETHQY